MLSGYDPTLLAWALSAFFVAGGLFNIIAPPMLAAEYAHWGYPSWFHYITGLCELSAAALMAFPPTRLPGGVLAMAVMAAAVITVLWHHQRTHAIAPGIVFVLTGAMLSML
ncbi:DoxX family protein [Paenirhodobacter enshiensis]|uniref:DoxX family protein n=1 Tax=Paenirhodobacter enshiensis TaxID=1105367 RepID=A0A086XS69_9RHOB|nr:DoxX family protein [Paenirhodobacter enshiensis]KFI24869.1 hypothetical protein CG50_07690 [Paenirhodobacter enshiensis]